MKSTQKQHIHHIIFICLLMVVGWGQDCEEGYTNIDDDCYFQSDLDVLQIFIDNSSETINMDMDVNGDGVIEPLELGYQDWNGGRLFYLDCYMWVLMKTLMRKERD